VVKIDDAENVTDKPGKDQAESLKRWPSHGGRPSMKLLSSSPATRLLVPYLREGGHVGPKRGMIFKLWPLLKDAVLGFINDEALSRGAAMAFFAVTSLAPIVLIIVAIAGLVFGREAAQHALAGQLNTIMGQQSADFIQSATANAANQTSGTWAAVVGLVTLLLTASGVFGEMQSALNVIWKAEPKPVSVEGLIRARAISLGLVAALGFLLIASLAISAAI